jgi:hypothetical protein
VKSEHSFRKVIPPAGVLPKLVECLMLTFLYERQEDRFLLVADYPERASGSDRAFVALLFGGVSEFEREHGDLEPYKRFSESYQAGEDSPTIVIQDVQVAEGNGGGHVAFWFGPSFGGVRCKYEDLVVVVRNSRVRSQGNAFRYADLKSGEEFDFERPFPKEFLLDAMKP